MSKLKLLLYCTKAKPYLNCDFGRDNHEEYSGEWNIYLANKRNECSNIVNGKIVAECDFEAEKIFGISRGTNQPDKYDFKWEDRILNGACLTNDQMNDYIPNYAIHIKNLHIFDEPRELNEFKVDNPDRNPYLMNFYLPLTKAPQNMMYVYDGETLKILISIRSPWMCLILNRIKDVELRKKVLRGMLK